MISIYFYRLRRVKSVNKSIYRFCLLIITLYIDKIFLIDFSYMYSNNNILLTYLYTCQEAY